MSRGWFDFGLFIILRAGFDGSVQVNHLLYGTHFLVWACSVCLDLDLKNGTYLIKLWSSLRRAIYNIVVRAPCFAPRLSLADLRAGCLGVGLISVCLLFFELDLKFWDSSATIGAGLILGCLLFFELDLMVLYGSTTCYTVPISWCCLLYTSDAADE